MFLLNWVSSVFRTTVHVPILVEEILTHLACEPGKNYLDLTLGGGGHTRALLEKNAPDGVVVSCDRDRDALNRAEHSMGKYKGRFHAVYRSLSQASSVIAEFSHLRLDGALIDAGISSDQLDTEERGFSFMREGPLDMRMDQNEGETARELLSRLDETALANLIYEFGEERNSRRIAKSIVLARKKGGLETTSDLAKAVIAASRGPKGKIHPATRTFQALRIAVNRELEELSTGLLGLLGSMAVGSRIAVLTFHSLEDRIVKNLFRDAKKAGQVSLVTKKPLVASRQEQRDNPRSRSAKLRVVEMLGAA